MKNVLIVEDNLIMAENLREIVHKASRDTCVYIAEKSDKAYGIAMEKDIDLMLVDIVLDNNNPGDVSGMKFAENIRKVERYKFIPIIMVTSLEDPKLYAYSEVHCYSYIEKPYDVNKVTQIIKDALQYKKNIQKSNKYMYKQDGIFYSIDLNDVIFAENKNKTVLVYTTAEVIKVPYASMGKLLEDFGNDVFLQCNRNCIINRNYIEFVDGTNRVIKMKGVLRQIDIGITLKKYFLAQLKND